MQQGALSRPASLPAHRTKWHLLSPRHKSHAAELHFLAVGVPEIKVKTKVKTKITKILYLLTSKNICHVIILIKLFKLLAIKQFKLNVTQSDRYFIEACFSHGIEK